MSTKKYISSGQIESCVLGNASPEEMKELVEQAKKHKEVAYLVRETQQLVEMYAMLHELQPPASVKQKLMPQIYEEADVYVQGIGSKRGGVKWSYYIWSAAAVVLITIGFSLTAYLWYVLQQKEEQISILTQNQSVLTMQHLQQKAAYELVSKELELLKNPGTLQITLKGLDIAPGSEAKIYWNKEDKKVYLTIQNLPEPPPGKQYQLWSLKNNQPSSAGLIPLEFETNTLLYMGQTSQAEAFAISLEKYGGAELPTIEAIYAMGSL